LEKKITESDSLITSKDIELNELKVAYKEKLRKCIAWEKVIQIHLLFV
jgi:hypothetical protein